MQLNEGAPTHHAMRLFLREHEPKVQKGWRGLIKAKAALVTEADVEYLKATGSMPSELTAKWRKLMEDFLTDTLEPAWLDGLKAGGNTLGRGIRRLRLDKSFTSTGQYSPTSIYAIQWLKERGGTLIHEWLEMDRFLLSDIIKTLTFDKPTSNYYIAEEIKDGLGLTARMYSWIDNRYDRVLEQALSDGSTPEQAARIADRDKRTYSYWLQQGRAQTVARTETSAAFNQGQLAAIREAQENGWAAHTVKVWSAAPDCCDDCQDLDGEVAELDDAYNHPNNASIEYTSGLTPPLHPNCRCVLLYETRE